MRKEWCCTTAGETNESLEDKRGERSKKGHVSELIQYLQEMVKLTCCAAQRGSIKVELRDRDADQAYSCTRLIRGINMTSRLQLPVSRRLILWTTTQFCISRQDTTECSQHLLPGLSNNTLMAKFHSCSSIKSAQAKYLLKLWFTCT